jgi:putative oxidoreductase
MALLQRIISTSAPASSVLIRLAVGAVFLSEGIQKYINPAEVGAGRFEKIGFANPQFLAPFVGAFEIVCGALILLGLLTRIATIPLAIVISTAIWTTKIPILMDKGFWAMAHEARTDYAMLLGLIFLLIVGAGGWSLDDKLSRG